MRYRGGPWRLGSLFIAGAAVLPLVVLFSAWLEPPGSAWAHLAATSLETLLWNTVLLMTGVAVGTAILGTGLAWLVSVCEFPGRRIFRWALALPLALPSYVMAFVFLGLLDFQGPVQGALLELLQLPPSASIDVRNTAGVLAVFILILYPYVYLLACVAFHGQGQTTFEAARTLGMQPARAFFRVSLPIARPAVFAGVSLAVMETLADFGAVAVFNYDTFTTAIYKSWFGMFDLTTASQLASLLLPFVLVVLAIERIARTRARFSSQGRSMSGRRLHLHGVRAGLACVSCALVLLLAFVIPFLQLLVWALGEAGGFDGAYFSRLRHTFSLGAMAAGMTLAGAFVLAMAHHLRPGRAMQAVVRTGTLGYAIPGSVLAVAVLLSLGWIDEHLRALWEWALGMEPQWTLVGSLLGLLLAYFVRFLTLAFQALDSSFEQFLPTYREAAESLALGRAARLNKVYLPMLRPGLVTAALLVLIDVMKEMPATLLLRPLGWDTIAVHIYGLTAEGLWEQAALPSITLIALGLIPVLLVSQRGMKEPALGPA